MVSKEEINFTHNWFVEKYIEFRRPLGSIVNLDNYTTKYSDSDMIRIEQRVKGLIYEMYGQFDKSFNDNAKFIALTKFGVEINELMKQFEDDFNNNFDSKKRTGGPVLLRISPFFDLENESLEIYLQVTENECISNPFEDLSIEGNLKNKIDNNLNDEPYVRRGCNIIIFHYDLQTEFQSKIDSLPYSNKTQRYIVIDGNALSGLLDMDINFMKQIFSITFVPNNSKLLFFIKQHPEIILKMGDLIKKWLFKVVSPKKINLI